MVPAQKSYEEQVSVTIHELFHLQISFYYMKYFLRKGLNKHQFSELNEIITSIMNQSVLKKLNLPSSKEYPRHKNLLKQINGFWLKDKNIRNLLDKSIILFKNPSN